MADARVLGIDPGLTRCGIGVVSGRGDRPDLVHAECIRTGADEAMELRLLALHDGVRRVIEQTRPTAVAVERVLFQTNVRTAMATGHAVGAVLVAAAASGLPVVQYSPNDVKLSVTGDGSAEKDAVSRMVVAQLRLAEAPRPVDVTDALAVAITHLARQGGAQPRGSGSAAAAPSATGWEAAIAANPHVRIRSET